MPIKTDLNISPYFDDFNQGKKYYRLLFKPSVAVQARELTQLQSTLQNQIEEFGANIFKEGSIVKGCSFTELANLQYVKVIDGINPLLFTERTEFDVNNRPVEYYYELEGATTNLKAIILNASRGFLARDPDLNTFYIQYLGSTTVGGIERKVFLPSETLLIRQYRIVQQEVSGDIVETVVDDGIVASTTAASTVDYVGFSYGLEVSSGIIFQKGHFLLVDAQTVIIEKYFTDTVDAQGNIAPHNKNVGFIVTEEIITSQQDTSLLDNANGSPNANAPGADRLKLTPILTVLSASSALADPDFFTLRRYQNGQVVTSRDVSQYNVIGEEFAKRTFEESGDYAVRPFDYELVRRTALGPLNLKLGRGVVYSKGFRVENFGDRFFEVDEVTSTTQESFVGITVDYGGYLNVTSANSTVTLAGNLPLGTMQTVELLNAANTVIGSTVVKDFTGSRAYVFNTRMLNANTSFADVRFLKASGQPNVPVSPISNEAETNRLIFNLPTSGVTGVSDLNIPVRRSRSGLTISANNITLTALADEQFSSNVRQNITVVSSGTVLRVNSTSFTSGSATINVNQASGTATVYYTADLANITPKTKELGTFFVNITYNSSTSAYSLGLPDCLDIVSIRNGLGTDFSPSFVLRRNQKDNFYDHSYIEFIPGRTRPANGTLTVQVRAFRVDASGSPYNFFTADSYSNYNPNLLPVFVGETGTYVLSDVIDFRPYRTPSVAYVTTAGSAPTVTSTIAAPIYTTQMFSSTNVIVPADDTVIYADIESTNARIDSLIVNSYGEFELIKGEESKKPRPQILPNDTVLAYVRIPSSPPRNFQESIVLGRPALATSVENRIPRRYTMKDIQTIENTIEDLRYYTVLNALEKQASDMLITDENGLDRFKSGILVDSFADLSIADLGDEGFNASIDKTQGLLNPSFKQYQLDMKFVSSSNTQVFDNKIGTLGSNTDIVLISQTEATTFRTCTSNFYLYKGVGELSPAYDTNYDTTTIPANNVNLDIASYFRDYTANLQNFIPLTTSQTQLLSSTTVRTAGVNTTTTTTTNTFADTVNALRQTDSTRTVEIGDFISDFSFQPFMASREIKVRMGGLRPSTRHYFFFDGKPVSQHVANGSFGSSGTTDSIQRSSAYGAAISTNANGVLTAVFRIPAGEFYVGDRVLEILDVDDYEARNSAGQSRGSVTYRAYNFSVTKSSASISLREPDFDVSTTTTNRTVVNRTVVTNPPAFTQRESSRDRQPPRGYDPLAQTFFVRSPGDNQSKTVSVTAVDVYFKRKSTVNGINVMIRTVDNGYPTATILPFANVRLSPAQVNVSDDGSLATRVTFPVPVKLEAEKEYALVLMPEANDPDYLAFTSKVGENDLITGNAVTQDWGDGVLFSSTNNRAWQSYQDEDLKFTIYRKNFSIKQGTLTLANNDHEFLTIEDTVGTFIQNELVYSLRPTTFVVGVTSGSRTITGNTASYDVGDHLYVENGLGVKQVFEIESVDTVAGTVTAKQPALFTAPSVNSRPALVGYVTSFDPREPNKIVLHDSSANSVQAFSVGTDFVGLESGATASVTTVDNISLSYVLPMINRTTDVKNTINGVITVRKPDNPLDAAYSLPISFNDKNTFDNDGAIIYSKSNDLTGLRNFRITLTLRNSYSDTFSSPEVDIESASVFAYVYNTTYDGDTTSRYISRPVTLVDGFEGEDMRVYVTAYVPDWTDIEVEARLQNPDDALPITSNPWLRLQKISRQNVFSSISNKSDFKEYVFEFDRLDIVQSSDGFSEVVEYSNTSGTYERFKKFQIRINLLSLDPRRSPAVADFRAIALR